MHSHLKNRFGILKCYFYGNSHTHKAEIKKLYFSSRITHKKNYVNINVSRSIVSYVTWMNILSCVEQPQNHILYTFNGAYFVENFFAILLLLLFKWKYVFYVFLYIVVVV